MIGSSLPPRVRRWAGGYEPKLQIFSMRRRGLCRPSPHAPVPTTTTPLWRSLLWVCGFGCHDPGREDDLPHLDQRYGVLVTQPHAVAAEAHPVRNQIRPRTCSGHHHPRVRTRHQTPPLVNTFRTLLGRLVHERRWTVQDFLHEYTAAARSLRVKADEIGERQAKRWMAGTLKTRPYPVACLVLETIFEYPIDDLLAPPARARRSPTVYAPALPTSGVSLPQMNVLPAYPGREKSRNGPSPDQAGPEGLSLMAADDRRP